MAEILNLFPTPVMITNMDRDLSGLEIKTIYKLLENSKPNRGNLVSEKTYVLEEMELLLLKAFCLSATKSFFSEVLNRCDVGLQITQSWLNESTIGQYHHVHNHPNSMISGVLYVCAAEGDIIQFHRQRDTNSFYFEVNEYNPYNSETWFVPVKTGQLFLFPSYLYHDVPSVFSTKRISLSFNTFATGPFGVQEMLCSSE